MPRIRAIAEHVATENSKHASSKLYQAPGGGSVRLSWSPVNQTWFLLWPGDAPVERQQVLSRFERWEEGDREAKRITAGGPNPADAPEERERRRTLGRENPLDVGRSAYTQHLKLHHYSGSLLIVDLTNAGKRGKKVKELRLIPQTLHAAQADAIISQAADVIVQQDMTYDQAVAYLESAGKGEYKLHENIRRGIDVEPAGVKISLEKKFDDGDIVRIDASPYDFMVNSSVVMHAKSGNGFRQDTLYSSRSKQGAIAFYAWLKENMGRASEMTIDQLRKLWDKLDVKYDYH
jgi:hypothetical protein